MASGRPSPALAAFSRAPAGKPQSPPAGWGRIWIRRGISARPCCESICGSAGNDHLKILIFGGAGFVGINIAAALLARGHGVTLFDRAAVPRGGRQAFAGYGDLLKRVQGDLTEPHSVENVIASGCDAIVLGAAITAGPA